MAEPKAQDTIGLRVMKCSETESDYECDVSIHGIQISEIEG